MIRNKSRGFGTLEILLITGFVVFLVIPLFSAVAGRIHIRYLIYRYTEIVDMAASAVVSELCTEELSKGEITIKSNHMLRERVETVINRNIRAWDQILSTEVVIHKPGEICTAGSGSDYDYLHILVNMEICKKPFSIRKIPVFIHFDLEIPFIR